MGKQKSKLVTLCFLLLLIPMSSAGRIQDRLKRLNKTPLKSIQSPDGDIIDCIPVGKQPALDHEDLKEHVIQMRPSCHPEGLLIDEGSIIQVWHEMKEKCPHGTVAIRRTKEDDLRRATSLHNFGKKKHRNVPRLSRASDPVAVPATPSNHEYAVAGVQDDVYYGTQATVSLWQPIVQSEVNEFSLSQLWITAGSYDLNNLNTIEVGWQVYPNLYNDTNTRLFTYWTRDAYNSTGCYNLLCSGFVQTSNVVAVGAAIGPVSVYNGTIYGFTMLVWKDSVSGNWWLKIGSENIGYWPSSLFTVLGSATQVQWGGEIVNTKEGGQHTSTDMGNGHFAADGASFFKNIMTVDANNTLNVVKAFSVFIVDNPNCYDLLNGTSPADGTFFLYGGSGRNPSCP